MRFTTPSIIQCFMFLIILSSSPAFPQHAVPVDHPRLLGTRQRLQQLAAQKPQVYQRVVNVARDTTADDYSRMISLALVAAISLPQQVAGRQLVAFQTPLGFVARTFAGTPDIGAYEWKNGPNPVRNVVRAFRSDYRPLTFWKGVVDARGRMVAASSGKDMVHRFAAGYYVERSKGMGADRGRRVVR